MDIKSKVMHIFLNLLPIIVMILLIPVIRHDFALTIAYIIIIVIAFLVQYFPKDISFFVFGFIVMSISEYFFIRTGVEVFERKSFLGVMPLWLPFLWAYGFVVMKRSIIILDK